MSFTNILINAFFVLLGAVISAGLAIWIEVSGVVERLRERKEASKEAAAKRAQERQRPKEVALGPGSSSNADHSNTGSDRSEIAIDFLDAISNSRAILGLILEALWDLRYIAIVGGTLFSGLFWLPDLLESRGASTQVINAVILGDVTACYGISAWVLTDSNPSLNTRLRLKRTAILTLSCLACFAIGLLLYSPLLIVGSSLGTVWALTTLWSKSERR